VESFHREARLLAKLQHPHIVAVYDFGRNALGYLYIVMEYVEGTSLLDVMKIEKLGLLRILQIAAQVCEALQFAHDHGVIHRDIKPTNILIDVRGRVRVADFGLARLIRTDSVTTSQSRSSLVMGTPVYAAPEQRRAHSNVDHRADIFSVGVTLYEMITGHVPVGVFDPPSRKAGCPSQMDKIITKTLRERPEDRCQNATELRHALLKVADRLARPVIQRTIARRPIISMMSTVIITSGLIYFFGEAGKVVEMSSRRDTTARRVALDETFSLLSSRLAWDVANRLLAEHPEYSLASLHSPEETERVIRILRDRGIQSPVWTGGHQLEPDGPYSWSDSTPLDFENWMPDSPRLVITEIQAKNQHTFRNTAGDTPDWIEVHNPGTRPVDLSGWCLKHIIGSKTFEARLGEGVPVDSPSLFIGPGDYKVITCHEVADDSPIHVPFQLEAQGGRIIWADPRGNIVQSFDRDWEPFKADTSLVSNPDGTRWGWTGQPTPGAPNPEPSRPFDVSVTPPEAPPRSILLLPRFEGRWTSDLQTRRALPLLRRTQR
jgi:serine/threonine protein kinase